MKGKRLIALVAALIIFIAAELGFSDLTSKRLLTLSSAGSETVALTLWHVDSFVGGKNSRADFLRKVAREYHKVDENVTIVVKSVTSKTLLENLSGDILPDLISFGSGDGETVLPYLSEYTGGVNVEGKFVAACREDGKTFAVPFCYGGYFAFGAGGEYRSFSGENVAPFAAAYFSDVTAISETLSREQAFEAFLGGGSIVATQREVVRALQRVADGRLDSANISPLCDYTDQLCAVGITKACKDGEAASKFIEFLTSDKMQKTLTNLYLFPCADIEIYATEPFSAFEKGRGKLRVMPLFYPTDILKRTNEVAKLALTGEEKSKRAIEEIVGG